MKVIDPIGTPRKERRRYGFWLSSDENNWLKKQLEIYRAQQITKEETEEPEEGRRRIPRGNNHE